MTSSDNTERLVHVPLGERAYDILIGPGLIGRAGGEISTRIKGRKAAIITDEHVGKLYLDPLMDSLQTDGIEAVSLSLPPGEKTKSFDSLTTVCDVLLEARIERNDTVIALGGGVIGDLTGFAAGIVRRGVRFVQIPTSLLSQVDSSVGGKTAINSTAGKNLVGSFHQPDMVLIDPDVLGTLPPRELRAGYAEVAKYGLIDDAAFFDWCETHGDDVLAGDADARVEAIAYSVRSKARIVGEDERETSGRRALLNLGHTFGHALEAETGFSDVLLHGEAVACGMALAFRFSAAQGLCNEEDAARVGFHLARSGLPSTLAEAHVDTSGATLVAHMAHDKKMEGGKLPFLLARGIGQTFLAKDVDLAEVERFLDGER